MQTIRIDNFTGGINSAAGRGGLAPNEARRVVNLDIREPHKLKPHGTKTLLFDKGAIDPIVATFRYESEAGSRLIYAYGDVGSGLTVIARNEATNAEITLGSGYTYTETPAFVQFGERLFFAAPGEPLQVWYGIGNVIDGGFVDAGIQPPSASIYTTTIEGVFNLSVSDGTGLDNTGYDMYSWCFTFYDSDRNVESNPSEWSPPRAATEEAVRLEIKVLTNPGGVAIIPNGVDKIRVYRRGGKASAEGQFAFEFVPIILGDDTYADNATGINPYDTIPDRDLSTEFLSLSNLPPPIGLEILIEHNHRLWGAGSADAPSTTQNPSWLWCSRPDEPESFGADSNGVDDDGGNLRIDDDVSDPIVALATAGGVLIPGRRKSVFAILGDGFEGAGRFQSSRRSNIGVASPLGLERADNLVFWWGTDNEVHRLGDADNQTVSEKLRPDLRALPIAQRSRANLVYFNDQLWVEFPVTASAVHKAYILNLETGGWWEFSHLVTTLPTTTFPTLRAWLSPGGLPPQQLLVAEVGAVYAYTDTDYYPGAEFLYTSDNLNGGDSTLQKKVTALRVLGTNVDTKLNAAVSADGVSRTYSLGAGTATPEGVFLDTGTHPDLVGRWLQVSLSGFANAECHISAIELDFEWERPVAR